MTPPEAPSLTPAPTPRFMAAKTLFSMMSTVVAGVLNPCATLLSSEGNLMSARTPLSAGNKRPETINPTSKGGLFASVASNAS